MGHIVPVTVGQSVMYTCAATDGTSPFALDASMNSMYGPNGAPFALASSESRIRGMNPASGMLNFASSNGRVDGVGRPATNLCRSGSRSCAHLPRLRAEHSHGLLRGSCRDRDRRHRGGGG